MRARLIAVTLALSAGCSARSVVAEERWARPPVVRVAVTRGGGGPPTVRALGPAEAVKIDLGEEAASLEVWLLGFDRPRLLELQPGLSEQPEASWPALLAPELHPDAEAPAPSEVLSAVVAEDADGAVAYRAIPPADYLAAVARGDAPGWRFAAGGALGCGLITVTRLDPLPPGIDPIVAVGIGPDEAVVLGGPDRLRFAVLRGGSVAETGTTTPALAPPRNAAGWAADEDRVWSLSDRDGIFSLDLEGRAALAPPLAAPNSVAVSATGRVFASFAGGTAVLEGGAWRDRADVSGQTVQMLRVHGDTRLVAHFQDWVRISDGRAWTFDLQRPLANIVDMAIDAEHVAVAQRSGVVSYRSPTSTGPLPDLKPLPGRPELSAVRLLDGGRVVVVGASGTAAIHDREWCPISTGISGNFRAIATSPNGRRAWLFAAMEPGGAPVVRVDVPPLR